MSRPRGGRLPPLPRARARRGRCRADPGPHRAPGAHRRRPPLRGATLATLAVYAHPLAGFATVALAAYAASLGLRARSTSPHADWARRRHAIIGPWLYAFLLLDWLAGLLTLWAWRPEDHPTETGHFLVGSLICAVFTAAALLSRRVPVDARARLLHPMVAAVGLVLCGVQVFLGLQLLP